MLNRYWFLLIVFGNIINSFSQNIIVTIQIVEVYHRDPSERDNFSVNIDNNGYYFSGGAYDYGAFQSSYALVSNVTNSSLNYDFYQIERSDLTAIPIYFFGYSDRCDGNNGHHYKYDPNCYCGFGVGCPKYNDYNFDDGIIFIRFWDYLNDNKVSKWFFTNGGAHGFRYILTWQPLAPNDLNYDKVQYCGKEPVHVMGVYNSKTWDKLSETVKNNLVFHWYYLIQNTTGSITYEYIKSTSVPSVEIFINNNTNTSIFKVIAVRVEFNGIVNPYYKYNGVPIEILPNPPDHIFYSLVLPKCFNDFNADIILDSVVGNSNGYFLNLRRGASVLYQSSVNNYPFSLVNQSNVILNDSSGLGSDYYVLSTTNYHNAILGCSRTDTIYISNKEPISVDFVKSNYNGYSVSCNGFKNGYLSFNARGGNGKYTCVSDSIIYYFDSSDKLVLGNLSASISSFRITDEKNCPAYDTVITLLEPLPLKSKTRAINIDCYGNQNGEIFLATEGGVLDYQYFLNNQRVPASSIDTLLSGEYKVYTEDRNGCSMDTTLFINEPLPLTHSVLFVNHLQCYDVYDGSVFITMSGGTSPYTYWMNNKLYYQGYIDSLPFGIQTYILRDSNSCEVKDSVELFAPTKISITSAVQHESCFNKKDGSIMYEVNGGIPNYKVYVNDHLYSEHLLLNLKSGDYYFKIIDNNLCEAKDTITVAGAKESITIVVDNITNATCNSIANGEIHFSVMGGLPPYKFHEESSSNSSFHIENLKGGYNEISIYDSLNCMGIDSVFIPMLFDLRLPFQDSLFICSTQDFVFADTSSFNLYWGSATGNAVSGDSILTSNQWYKVYTIENQHHCMQLDSFIVVPLNDYVNATFLLPSVVYQSDTIFLIDINTTAVDSINISSSLEVSQLTDRRWYIISSDTGSFDISFKAYSGLCSDELVKTVTVKSAYSLRSMIDDPLGYQGFLNLIIYPNPFQSAVYCQGELATSGNIDLTFWDVLGNVILQKRILDITTFKMELETDNLPSGVYFIQLSALDEMVRIKLIKDQSDDFK